MNRKRITVIDYYPIRDQIFVLLVQMEGEKEPIQLFTFNLQLQGLLKNPRDGIIKDAKNAFDILNKKAGYICTICQSVKVGVPDD